MRAAIRTVAACLRNSLLCIHTSVSESPQDSIRLVEGNDPEPSPMRDRGSDSPLWPRTVARGSSPRPTFDVGERTAVEPKIRDSSFQSRVDQRNVLVVAG